MGRRATHGVAAPESLRERRKRMTREELLRAGRRLFSEKGLYMSRVEDLTSQAGIAKGTLYQYFGNKEELILAVVEAGFEDLGRLVGERVQGTNDTTACLVEILMAHGDFFVRNPDLMRVFHQVRGALKFGGAQWDPLRAVLDRHLDSLAGILSDVKPPLAETAAVRRELAELLFGAVSGAFSVRASTRPRAPLAPAPRALALALSSMVKTFAAERGQAPARIANAPRLRGPARER